MDNINFTAAWIGIGFGLLSGLVMGLWFHQDNWMGGYSSWRRRLVRLAHISFFGLGFLNFAFSLSLRFSSHTTGYPLSSMLLIIGAISMPLVCYLAAWRKPFRHFFAIPVLSLVVGTLSFVLKGVLS